MPRSNERKINSLSLAALASGILAASAAANEQESASGLFIGLGILSSAAYIRERYREDQSLIPLALKRKDIPPTYKIWEYNSNGERAA